MLHNELKVIQVEYKNKVIFIAKNNFIKKSILFLTNQIYISNILQVNDCERLESENKKLDCCKLKLDNQVASLKETVIKLENNNSNLNDQNLASNVENSNLRKVYITTLWIMCLCLIIFQSIDFNVIIMFRIQKD